MYCTVFLFLSLFLICGRVATPNLGQPQGLSLFWTLALRCTRCAVSRVLFRTIQTANSGPCMPKLLGLFLRPQSCNYEAVFRGYTSWENKKQAGISRRSEIAVILISFQTTQRMIKIDCMTCSPEGVLHCSVLQKLLCKLFRSIQFFINIFFLL